MLLGGGGNNAGGNITGTAASKPAWMTSAVSAAAKWAPGAQLWAGNAVPILDWAMHNTGLGQEYILGTKEKGSTFKEIGENAEQWWNDYKDVLTNSRDYFVMIGQWLQEAAKYAEENEETVPDLPKSEPTENWEYGEDWGIQEILEDLERRRNESSSGGNTGNTDGLTSGDAKSMTEAVNKMPAEVRKGMTGIKVYMDRYMVGQLVAEEVSKQIAGWVNP
jgi:hypothetical protein